MTTKNFTQVGILGDTHGNKGWTRVALYSFAQAGITEIVQVGDFGFWPGNSGQKFLHRVNKTLGENGQTLYVTLGNHEDYVQISRFQPHPTVADHVYDRRYPNILVAKRGARWNWNGVSFVSLGGANSIDFTGRTEWVSWWKGEQITALDVYKTLDGGHADIMITHDCPAGVNLWPNGQNGHDWTPTELRYAQESRDMLRHSVDGVKPEMLFHGHYHFYIDATTTLNDGDEDYTLRTVGLDMDGSQNSMAVLDLPSKKFEVLPVAWDDRNYTN
jgi:hypothetical protein